MSLIRILHFSDFHLDGGHEDEAKHLLNKMIEAIENNSSDKNIDLIIFSGDMINQGGHGFDDITKAFNSFLNLCIEPLLKKFGLKRNRFFFAIGNHDLHVTQTDEYTDKGIDSELVNEKSVKCFVDKMRTDLGYLKRQAPVMSFRDNFYKDIFLLECVFLTPFQSNFKIEISGIKIGITSLNTSWRCCFKDKDRLVTGLWQITESEDFLKECDLKLAVGHHHYTFMKEFESKLFLNLLSKNYNAYFSGHAHSYSSNLMNPDEEWLMDIVAPGALSGNIYEDREPYKNGFQIVDIDTEEHNYYISKYIEENYDGFILQKNYKKHIPQLGEFQELEVAKKAAEESKKELATLKQAMDIEPFEPIRKFINEFEWTYDFIGNKVLNGIIKDFREESQNIRLLALSGMGKSRLIWEAFKNNDINNVFYTSSSNIANALKRILKDHKDESGVIILDNCNHDVLSKAENIVRDWNHKFRIISLCNDLSSEQRRCNGRILDLDYTQTVDIVDSYLKRKLEINNAEEKERLINVMRTYSGNIPYMAFMLVDSYKTLGEVKINNADEVLNNLLQNPTEDEIKVLEAIAIFKLVGYKEDRKFEYELIKNESNIHHIMGKSEKELSYLFDITVNKYKQKQLIEELTQWINLRPQPLAEWLVEKWFDNTTSDTLIGMFERLSNDPKSGMLIESFCKRIESIGNNEREKEIIKNVLLPKYGPFCNESVVISPEGSRLMLSMANVNQEAVATCMFYLFGHKDPKYLREKIKDKTRWNLNQTLAKCCVRSESFYYAARVLGRLAEAENENYSNNATGLFCQLFHILLPGTEVDFNQRVEVLKYFYNEGSDFYPLIIKSIHNAFITHGLIKDGNANKLGNIEYPDYKPKSKEIAAYWQNCTKILKDLINIDPEICGAIADMFSDHARDFCWYGSIDILVNFMEFIAPRVNYSWLKMRNNIHVILNSSLLIEDSSRLILSKWEEKLTPTDFLSRLRDAYQFGKTRLLTGEVEKKFEKESKLMQPFVDEFVRDKLYMKDILGELLDDNEFYNWVFCRLLSDSITKLSIGSEINKFILAYVCKKDKNYSSSFLLNVCNYNFRENWVGELRDEFYAKKYYSLAISFIGLTDDDSLSGLDAIIEDVSQKKYTSEYINNYLCNFHFNTLSNILIICDKLYQNKNVDKIKVFYPYIMNYSVGDNQNADYQKFKRKLSIYLVEYDFSIDNNYQNAHSVVRRLEDYLNENEDTDLAKQFNHRIIETLTNKYLLDNPFEFSYFTLLPKYEEVVIPELFNALSLPDEQSGFYLQMMYHIGSGYGDGVGPLFQCNLDLLKERCIQNPDTLPERLAAMCPVYKYEKLEDGRMKEIGFSEFFYWLIEKFPDNVHILENFDANMNTISWSGVGSMAYLYQRNVDCFKLLLDNKNKIVRDWAESGIELAENEVHREKSRDDFEEVFYK